MGPPPAKRQKRLVVLNSEGEEEEPPTLKPVRASSSSQTSEPTSKDQNTKSSKTRILPTRLRSKHEITTKSTRAPATKPSPPSSPKKPGSKPRTAHRKDPQPSYLDTYFSAANRSNATKESASHREEPGTAVEEEDFIEDDSFDDELRKLADLRKTVRGRGRQTPVPILKESAGSSKLLPGSQIFRRLGDGVWKEGKDQKAPNPRRDDTRPWGDRYGPVSIEELAVHKKKVADVRDWLQSVFEGRSKKRLLVLKGASGVGKTAAVSTLARAMGFDILEWMNPTVSDFSSDNYLSTLAQFEDFLERSGKFTSLQVAGSRGGDTLDNFSLPEQVYPDSNKKVILVEEFPNTFMSSSTALQSFRSSILRYLATSSSRAAPCSSTFNEHAITAMPLILIITESETTSTTSFTDIFTAHRLLGPDILAHPDTSTIEFNPIAPTYITKALNLTIQKEARYSGRRWVPGPSVLKRLSEAGDVRSAIGALEFLCLKGQDADDWGGRVVRKGKKGIKTATGVTEMEERGLELVTRREASLGLFHAVGKVVYNKREGLPDSKTQAKDPPTQPPDYLPQHVRLKLTDVNVDGLVDETGTDIQTFMAALHENYVLSCSGSEFIDTLNACIENLSDTDILISSERGTRFRANAQVTESIRQDEIAFQVAVRGLLFSLPCPVERSDGGKGGDAFKMFYPASMRLGRQILEIEDTIESWMRRRRGSGAASSSSVGGFGEQGTSGEDDVLAWAQKTMQPIMEDGDDGDEGANCGACRGESKDAVVLEVLPYTALVQRSLENAKTGLGDELERITNVMRKSTQQPAMVEASAKGSSSSGIEETAAATSKLDAIASQMAPLVEQGVNHLYLSDDDIED
ncbi:MAG: hypothetical protein Q9201_003315 [Fulgogasparrea decipioides]